MVEGAGPLPRKIIIFDLKLIALTQFLTDTDITVQSQNEAYKNSAKIIQKFTVRSRGGRTIAAP